MGTDMYSKTCIRSFLFSLACVALALALPSHKTSIPCDMSSTACQEANQPRTHHEASSEANPHSDAIVAEQLARRFHTPETEGTLLTKTIPLSISPKAAKTIADCGDPPSQETTLLYHIFLGFWGAGYGYIDRWWLFAAALAPGIIGCMLQCAAKSVKMQGDECDKDVKGSEDHDGCRLALQIIAGIFICWNLGFWIWGMVQICNNDLKTGDGCTLKPDL